MPSESNEEVDPALPRELVELLIALGFVRFVPVDERVPQTRLDKIEQKEEESMTTATKKIAATTDDKMVDVERHGKKLIIPEGMKYADAREWLARKEKSEEEVASVYELVETFPLDGSYAFMRAMERIYGWTDIVPTPGFWGPTPPMMIGLQVDVDKTVQVLWGRATIPNVEGFLDTGFALKDGRIIFAIRGQVKRKDLPEVKKIAALTREIATQESVYKGKAIRIAFEKVTPENFNPDDAMPTFFDTRTVKVEDLVFPDVVQELVEVNIFTPIEKTAECRKHQIPLKRGILLEGPYGTGKTLTADVSAKKAVDNGWTFIYLENVKQLQQAIYFAQQYQPAVIFAEDIDSVVTGERDEEMNDILNTIDGVDTKRSEIMVILTTNHVDLINKAMLRPGRLDAVISVRPPDAKAVNKLVRLYGRTLLDKEENIDEACEVLAGQIPATVREVVERSKLAAIRRRGGETLRLTGDDLKLSAKGMMAHLELMVPTIEDKRSVQEKSATIIAKAVESLGHTSNGHAKTISAIGHALLPADAPERA